MGESVGVRGRVDTSRCLRRAGVTLLRLRQFSGSKNRPDLLFFSVQWSRKHQEEKMLGKCETLSCMSPVTYFMCNASVQL